MYKPFRVVLLLLLGCLPALSRAQPTTYLDLGTALTSHTIKDDAMSPVRYRGVVPGLSFGIMKEKPTRRLTELRGTLQYGVLRSRYAKDHASMRATFFRADIDYIYLKPTRLIRDSLNGVLFLGPSFHMLLGVRFMPQLDNSAIIYDNHFSIGVNAAYRNGFSFRSRKLMHYHRLSVPLLSYATRPGYMSVYDVVDPEGGTDIVAEAFEIARFRSLVSLQRVIIRNTLFWPIRSQNKVGLTYEWQYYGASFTVPVRSAYHQFMFSLLVNI